MNVNCTLFVQIANFFIAYTLLKRFLWRPVVKSIEQEASLRRVLESSIGAKRAQLMQKNDSLRRQWYEAKKNFAQESPKIVQPNYEISAIEVPREIPVTSQPLVEELVTFVVRQVRHDE